MVTNPINLFALTSESTRPDIARTWTSTGKIVLTTVREGHRSGEGQNVLLKFDFLVSDLCEYSVIVFYDYDGTASANILSDMFKAFRHLQRLKVWLHT